MKPSIINLPIALIAALLSGCISTRSISPSTSSQITPSYDQGVAVLKSHKRNAVVVRLLSEEFSTQLDQLPSLFVAMANGSDSPVDFSTANISARSGKKSVRVYTHEDLAKLIKRQAAILAMAVALNSAGQAMAASAPQTAFNSGSVYASGPGGYANASYLGTTTTYNPAAAAAAQSQINAQTMSQMTSIASSRDIQINNLGSVLRRNTVSPGEFAGGLVKLRAEDIQDGTPLELVVTIDHETHVFQFEINK